MIRGEHLVKTYNLGGGIIRALDDVTLDIEEQKFGRGQEMKFTVTLETAPDFTLPTYKGLKAQRQLAVASDADVDRALNILRDQQGRNDGAAMLTRRG